MITTKERDQKKKNEEKGGKKTRPTVAERLDEANLRPIEDILCVLESFPEIRLLPLGRDLREEKKKFPLDT